MQDYYAQLGLNRTATPAEIAAAIAGHPEYRDAAAILQDPLKKQRYDEALDAMHGIGLLRAGLNLQTQGWCENQAPFVKTDQQGRKVRLCRQLQWGRTAFRILFPLLLIVNLVLLVLYKDHYTALQDLPVFSLFEDKAPKSPMEKLQGFGPGNRFGPVFAGGTWRKTALKDIAAFGSKYYKVFDSSQIPVVKNWEDAQGFCKQQYGNLAVIESAEENAFLTTWLNKIRAKDVFFGLTDKDTEGSWRSHKGKATYTNWAPGEPNNEFGREHYAMFYHRSPAGTWNDGIPGKNFLFLCQWDNERAFSNYERQCFGVAENIYRAERKDRVDARMERVEPPKNARIHRDEVGQAGRNTGQMSENRSSKTEPHQKQPPAPAVPSFAGSYSGAWETAQEPVAFSLQISERNGAWSAELEFYPLDPGRQNASNSGKYRLTGRYDSTAGELILTGREWLVRPPNASFVHLRGRLNRNLFEGTVFTDTSNPGWRFSATKSLSH